MMMSKTIIKLYFPLQKTSFISLFVVFIPVGLSHPSFYSADVYKRYTSNDVPFTTLWPLQSGFPGANIPNLNEYLEIFSRCLVNVQNFQGIDLVEWNYPIHTSRFDVAGVYEYYAYNSTVKLYSSRRFFFEKVPRNLTELYNVKQLEPLASLNEKTSLKFKWNCYAQFDLFHPEIKDAFHFYLHKMAYHSIEQFIFYPKVNRPRDYAVMFEEDSKIRPSARENTRPIYLLLVTTLNTSLATKDFWLSNKLDLGLNRDSPKLFYLFTENFKQLHPTRSQQLTIVSFNFICLSCCACKKVIIPLNSHSWEIVMKKLLRAQRNPWIVDDETSYLNPEGLMNGFLIKTNNLNAFRQYMSSPKIQYNLPDKFLADIILPNVSFMVKSSQNEKDFLNSLECSGYPEELVETLTEYSMFSIGKQKCLFSKLYLQSDYAISVMRYKDEYTFLSCGAPTREKISIAGLFSSFDKATWVCLLAFVFVWPISLSLIENDFNFRHVVIDSQTWLLGLVLLLEQGHYLATNNNRRGPLYYTCGLTLLVLIVVSNAYKGDNIQSLTKLLQPIPYTTFKQIHDAKLTLLSPMVIKYNYISMVTTGTEFSEVVERLGWQLSENKTNETASAVQLHPLAEKIAGSRNKTTLAYGDIMDECNEVALLGWRNDFLHPIYDYLYERKTHEGKLFVGQEILFRKEGGWSIQRWNDDDIPLRIANLRSSGIDEQWMTLLDKNYPSESLKPFKLNLKGNVVVQFYCLLVGLVVSGFVGLFELRKPVSRMVLVVSKYIRRFVLVFCKYLGLHNSMVRVDRKYE